MVARRTNRSVHCIATALARRISEETVKVRRRIYWALLLGALAVSGGLPVAQPADLEATANLEPFRLEVGWISREPRLDPPASLDAAPEEGWPDAGSAVHWVAHVFNRSDEVASAVPYAWTIDDEVVLRGVVDLIPGRTEILLPWIWRFARHEIGFAISPPRELGDATTADDQIAIAGDALALVFIDPVAPGSVNMRFPTACSPGHVRVANRSSTMATGTLPASSSSMNIRPSTSVARMASQ